MTLARSGLTAAFIVAAIAVLGGGAQPAAGQDLARTGPLEFVVEPIGFDGADVVAVQHKHVLAFGTGGRRVLDDRDVGIGAVASSGLLAFVRGHLDGPDQLLFGPTAGPRRTVLTCDKPRTIAPALAGARVVWPACDGRSLVIAGAAGQVSEQPAGGEVRALAADGDRVAWLAADDAEPANITVHTLDLATGAARVAGKLGTATGGGAETIHVAVARDGRLRATLEDLGSEAVTCTTLDERRMTPGPARRGRCPWQIVFTDDGSVQSEPLAGGDGSGAIVHRARSGAAIATVARYAGRVPRPFATDGERVAISLLTCRGARLVAGNLTTARFTKPTCPVRPLRRSVTATRSGVVRIGVRCPQGCFTRFDAIELRLGSLGTVPSPDQRLDLEPGGAASLAFRLGGAKRRGLARRGHITARVDVQGQTGAVRFAVRVRASA